jgi:hypothetical protein
MPFDLKTVSFKEVVYKGVLRHPILLVGGFAFAEEK